MPDFSKAIAADSGRKFTCGVCKTEFPKDTPCYKLSNKTICIECFAGHENDDSDNTEWDVLPCAYADGKVVCPKCGDADSHIVNYGLCEGGYFFVRACHQCFVKYRKVISINDFCLLRDSKDVVRMEDECNA